MNETQLLLWLALISALRNEKNKQKKDEFKKEPECIYGKVWKCSGERQRKIGRLSQSQR